MSSGALVARKTQLPVLTSSGAVYGGTAEAVVTTRSRNTRTNARESAALLLPLGITRVLLVAHSFDMPRAIAEFDSAGLRVIPAPTAVIGDRPAEGHPFDWLPGMAALQGNYYALYEFLAGIARVLP